MYRFHIYLNEEYYKSVYDTFEIELELGSAIKSTSYSHNRRVYITLNDEYNPEEFIRKAA